MKKKVLIWGIILAVLTAGIVLGIIYREPIGNWFHEVFVPEEIVQNSDDETTGMPDPDLDDKLDDIPEIDSETDSGPIIYDTPTLSIKTGGVTFNVNY